MTEDDVRDLVIWCDECDCRCVVDICFHSSIDVIAQKTITIQTSNYFCKGGGAKFDCRVWGENPGAYAPIGESGLRDHEAHCKRCPHNCRMHFDGIRYSAGCPFGHAPKWGVIR